MNIRKNTPTVATARGTLCPVCGSTSYSRGGVHPQCSQLLADEPLLAVKKGDRAAEKLLRSKP
jgi:hypothetical protein